MAEMDEQSHVNRNQTRIGKLVEEYLRRRPDTDPETLRNSLLDANPDIQADLNRALDSAERYYIASVRARGKDETEQISLRSTVIPAATDCLSLNSNRYVLIRQLGRGGQGTAWLARDEVLGRSVVVKTYALAAVQTQQDRIVDEYRALSAISSPHVPAGRDLVFKEEEGEIWLVMDYRTGRSLHELIQSESYKGSYSEIANLVAKFARALALVHVHGVCHRDIKPQNLILGDDGEPVIVDFGLAVPIQLQAQHHSVGTPAYLSPEQARETSASIFAVICLV